MMGYVTWVKSEMTGGRERKRDEEARARRREKKAHWFPGAGSSAETDVMASADVFDQRENLNESENHLSFWPIAVTWGFWCSPILCFLHQVLRVK